MSKRADPAVTAANLPRFDETDTEGNLAVELLTRKLWNAWSEGTNKSYRGAWQNFLLWCITRSPPVDYLPCTEATLAMYMALQASKCQSFSVIKTISAAVRQAHLIMGFPSPTLGIHPALIRSAAQRELGVKVKNVKAPWQLSH